MSTLEAKNVRRCSNCNGERPLYGVQSDSISVTLTTESGSIVLKPNPNIPLVKDGKDSKAKVSPSSKLVELKPQDMVFPRGILFHPIESNKLMASNTSPQVGEVLKTGDSVVGKVTPPQVVYPTLSSEPVRIPIPFWNKETVKPTESKPVSSFDSLYPSLYELIVVYKDLYIELRKVDCLKTFSDKTLCEIAFLPFENILGHSNIHSRTCNARYCLHNLCWDKSCKHKLCSGTEIKICDFFKLVADGEIGCDFAAQNIINCNGDGNYMFPDQSKHMESNNSLKSVLSKYLDIKLVFIDDGFYKNGSRKKKAIYVDVMGNETRTKEFNELISGLSQFIMGFVGGQLSSYGYEWNGYYGYVKTNHPMYLAWKGDLELSPETFHLGCEEGMLIKYKDDIKERNLHTLPSTTRGSFKYVGSCSWSKSDIQKAILKASGFSTSLEHKVYILQNSIRHLTGNDIEDKYITSKTLRETLNLSLLTGNPGHKDIPLPSLGIEWLDEDNTDRKTIEKFYKKRRDILRLVNDWEVRGGYEIIEAIYNTDPVTSEPVYKYRWGDRNPSRGYLLLVYKKLIEKQRKDEESKGKESK